MQKTRGGKMALKVDYPITIDLNKTEVHHSIAVQGDDLGRRLIISFTTLGEPLDLTGCSANIKCSFNDETIAVNTCKIENNQVVAVLTKTMLADFGSHKLQISLFDSSETIISSPIIYIYVSESIKTDETTKTKDFSELNNLIAKIQSLMDNPAVGETEIKDARGNYTLLGDRLAAQESNSADILRFLNSVNCVKKSSGFNTPGDIDSSKIFSDGLSLNTQNGCIVAQGSTNQAGTIYALFDQPKELQSGETQQLLAVMRIKAIDNPLTIYPIGGRYSGGLNHFCSSNLINSNITDFIGDTSSYQNIPADEWVTIWALLGGRGQNSSSEDTKTSFNGLGIYISPPTGGYAPKVMIQSLNAYTNDTNILSLIYERDSKLENINNQFSSIQENINKINQSVDNVSDGLAKVSSIETNVTKNSDRISTLEGNNADTSRTLNQLEELVLYNKQTLQSVQGQTISNSAKLEANTIDITGLKSTVNNHSNDIETLWTKVNESSAKVAEFESQTESYQSQMDSIQTTIASTTGAIPKLLDYVGYEDSDIIGLQVDYQNNIFTRLGNAVGKTAGYDFDIYPMYGGRKRCNVADDGTINAYYGDDSYTDDGTNGQVMVYQPAFYYKIVPLKLEKQSPGLGYNIHKANYYISSAPKPGFKLHPAFYDTNGHPTEYILFSAYEGSMYDASEASYVHDGINPQVTAETGDTLCSVAGKKPISGFYKSLTPLTLEELAQNRGPCWHMETIKSLSANQLLMIIELGTMNTQSAIGMGVVSIRNNNSFNCSSLTGSTASLGNSSGQAAETINEIGGTETIYNTDGKTSITYRGMENPWGNIGKYINCIYFRGNGSMNGGQAYISDDLSYAIDTEGNFKPVGFSLPNSSGYIKAMGYGLEEYDWLIMPSEVGGTSELPVGDYISVKQNQRFYSSAILGYKFSTDKHNGAFRWECTSNIYSSLSYVGGRLLYIPNSKVNS